MHYQQTSITRLSTAARRLEKDGRWHPFSNDPAVQYRVALRVVQQVRLEEGEHPGMLDLLDPPVILPSFLLREGFRGGLRLRIEDDHVLLSDVHLPAVDGWEALAGAAHEHAAHIRHAGGNLLTADIRIDAWTAGAINAALVTARALADAVAALRLEPGAEAAALLHHCRRSVEAAFDAWSQTRGRRTPA